MKDLNELNTEIELIKKDIIQENAKDEKIHQMIHTHEFKLEHIVENKDRSQNSTACITIQPYDIFPYPKVNVRY